MRGSLILWMVCACCCSLIVSEHAFAGGRQVRAANVNSTVAVVTNWGGDTISLVDIQTGKELSKIAVGPKPYDICCDAKGAVAYATCSGADFISKIDLVANLEMKDQRIVVGRSPRDISLTSDGKRAVVACSGADHVAIVDLIANKVLYTIEVGSIPYGVGLAPDDKTAIITLWGSNKAVLVEIGDAAGKITKTFEIGSLPYTAWVTNNANYAIVTCFGSSKVYVIDLKNGNVLDPVAVGRSPWGLALSPDGENAAVMNFYSGDVSLLSIEDVARDPVAAAPPPVKEAARIKLMYKDPVGAADAVAASGSAKNAAYSPDGKSLLMSDLAKNQIMLMDAKTRSITKVISVGEAPYGIAFVPRNK